MKWFIYGDLYINIQNIAYVQFKEKKDSGSKDLTIGFANGLIFKETGIEAATLFQKIKKEIEKASL